jgi:hypothetical protein
MGRSTSLTSFLRRLQLTWLGFIPGAFKAILPEEPLTRYLPHSNCFKRSPKRVTLHAFMPAPKDKRTSVFRTTGLTDASIRELGDLTLTGRKDATLYGRADVAAREAFRLKLIVERDLIPSRHVNIAGWSQQDKALNKLLAMKLADLASLTLYA